MQLAHMLERSFAFSSFLKMRRCTDTALCAKTSCRLQGSEYHCPISLFLDQRALEAEGIVLVRDDNSLSEAAAFLDPVAFDELYAPGVVVVNRAARNASGHVLERFQYFQSYISCELAVKGVLEQTWDLNISRNTNSTLIDFIERYGAVQSQVLNLRGTPHRIGQMPVNTLAREELLQMHRRWARLRTYNPHVEAHARQLVGLVLGRANASTFVCVHLRGDDFSDLGWNVGMLNSGRISKRVRAVRRPGEALYIATDEESLVRLAGLRDFGGQLWSDVAGAMMALDSADGHMLGFMDYVGLVEQRACVMARTFVGSRCSSFSGTIANMRRDIGNHHSP